jgi:hypothetical protein
MPIHDWTVVDAGIFHDFHHSWMGAISDTLNGGLLPEDYYALVQPYPSDIEPDLFAVQVNGKNMTAPAAANPVGKDGVKLAAGFGESRMILIS